MIEEIRDDIFLNIQAIESARRQLSTPGNKPAEIDLATQQLEDAQSDLFEIVHRPPEILPEFELEESHMMKIRPITYDISSLVNDVIFEDMSIEVRQTTHARLKQRADELFECFDPPEETSDV